jgi:sulfatase maturation enzyme AslB (radical SAM superfamily)
MKTKPIQWDHDFDDRYVLIEPTDMCNMDCIMCSRSLMGIETPHKSPTGHMEMDVFQKIVDDLDVGSKPMAIKLFWLGESMIHPRFTEMLRYIYEKIKDTNAYLDIHTNAMLLTPEIIRLLIDIGEKIPVITFSIDAAKKETFKSIRVKGDFERTVSNIRGFVETRERTFSEYPKFIFQFIVMKENHEEAKMFVEYWRSFLDETRVNNISEVWSELDPEKKKLMLKRFEIEDEWKRLEDEKKALLKCLEP